MLREIMEKEQTLKEFVQRDIQRFKQGIVNSRKEAKSSTNDMKLGYEKGRIDALEMALDGYEIILSKIKD